MALHDGVGSEARHAGRAAGLGYHDLRLGIELGSSHTPEGVLRE